MRIGNIMLIWWSAFILGSVVALAFSHRQLASPVALGAVTVVQVQGRDVTSISELMQNGERLTLRVEGRWSECGNISGQLSCSPLKGMDP